MNDTNNQDILEGSEDYKSIGKIPITKGFEKIIKEIENKKKSNMENDDFEISARKTEREIVKEFVSELFL